MWWTGQPGPPRPADKPQEALASSADRLGARGDTGHPGQGSRPHRLGGTLAQALEPHVTEMAAFADKGSIRLSRRLAALWAMVFPMVLPPDTEDGLGVIVLNSNAETHFSFECARDGPIAQAKTIDIAAEQYPRACWIVALHHHVVEYPKPAKALSERIGTALINGSWFVRRLQRLADHAVVMHGHRHIDWIGETYRVCPIPCHGSDR
jgi:hypothetical protein